MIKNIEDVQKISKDNMDATMKSFGAVSKGAQAIATEVADYSKKSFEDGTKVAEKLLGAKSLEKAIEIQTDYCEDRLRGVRRAGDQDRRALCRSRQGDLQAVRGLLRQVRGEVTAPFVFADFLGGAAGMLRRPYFFGRRRARPRLTCLPSNEKSEGARNAGAPKHPMALWTKEVEVHRRSSPRKCRFPGVPRAVFEACSVRPPVAVSFRRTPVSGLGVLPPLQESAGTSALGGADRPGSQSMMRR